MNILALTKQVIDYAAIVIMVWGTLRTIIKTVVIEFKHKGITSQIMRREQARVFLGSYILLGLEIFIVADIIEIIIKPTFEDLMLLIIIVFVRTIISFFLGREMQEASSDIQKLEKEEKEGN